MIGFILLNSSKDALQKLIADYATFEQEPASAYKAIDCASSAWHLTDWVWNEYEKAAYGPNGIGKMREDFQTRCPELMVMHDIVTGAKHFTVSRPKSDMSGSSIALVDAYTNNYRDSYGLKMLMVEFASQGSQDMLSLLGKVAEFWVDYLDAK